MRLISKRFELEAEDAAANHCVCEHLLTDGTEISGGDHRSSVTGFVWSYGKVG